MRKQIAAGNWKMNLSASEAQELARGIVNQYREEYQGDAQVIFAPPYPYLSLIAPIVDGSDQVFLAAQNLHQEEKGAYTGEVAASMLVSVGATHVLIGHSERRQYFGEGNELLASKVDKALEHGLVPVFCIGETLDQREAGQTLDVIRDQLSGGTFHLDGDAFSNVIVAYEPVWAIGTGKTATPDQAQEVHQFIRSLITEKYGDQAADDTTILYGGSVKPSNASELFAKPDIDGGLVGGASLKIPDFVEIIKAL